MRKVAGDAAIPHNAEWGHVGRGYLSHRSGPLETAGETKHTGVAVRKESAP